MPLIRYASKDGLSDEDVFAILVDREGNIWIGTKVGGLNRWREAEQPNDVPPPVVVEKVLIDGRPVDPWQKAESPPGRGDVEIHYAGLSFVAPEQVRFRYKLEGYDEDWVDAGPQRVASYTGVPPGEYQFRVIASNDNGVWNETGAAFEFSLSPHFYQTRLFYVLVALALGALGWGLYRRRVRHAPA